MDNLNNIKDSLEQITNSTRVKMLTLKEWSERLAEECNVYRMDEQYLARSFDSIAYKLCSEDTAVSIFSRNIDIVLNYKYFPNPDDETTDRIEKIKSYCVKRISALVKKVKFTDSGQDGIYIKSLPASCVAFNNGVYDFQKSTWLFKYKRTKIDESKCLIEYDPSYRIMWYVAFNYEPKVFKDVPLDTLSFEEFYNFMKERDKEKRSMFFELFHNMSYGQTYLFEMDKAKHLAEVLGFLLYAPFVQQFVFMIGDGSNGKDSMFDAFYRSIILPIPSTNTVYDLEVDKFIASSLVGVGQNICSETETGTLTRSSVLKQLTGSEYQTIEEKGVDKYTGYMNCKLLFAANNKEQLKFRDTSMGFRRRINMYECFYQWDKYKRFLKTYPDSYDTSYSSTEELKKGDSMEEFFLTAMYGVKMATNNFTKPFSFTFNDYDFKEYAEIDEDFVAAIAKLNIYKVRSTFLTACKDPSYANTLFFSEERINLRNDFDDMDGFMAFKQNENYLKVMAEALKYNPRANPEEGEYPLDPWFLNHSFFIRTDFLFDVYGSSEMKKTGFTINLKRSFPKCDIEKLYANQTYILVHFDVSGDLRIDVKGV